MEKDATTKSGGNDLTIAEALRDTLIKYAEETGLRAEDVHIWQGNYGLLHDAYERAGRKARHSLNGLDAVMAAVRRSSLFEKIGTRTALARVGANREVSFAVYKLRKQK